MHYNLASKSFENARFEPELAKDLDANLAWQRAYRAAKTQLKVYTRVGAHHHHTKDYAERGYGKLPLSFFVDAIKEQDAAALVEYCVRQGYLYDARHGKDISSDTILAKFEQIYDKQRTQIRKLVGALKEV
jgi:hypothetical protein